MIRKRKTEVEDSGGGEHTSPTDQNDIPPPSENGHAQTQPLPSTNSASKYVIEISVWQLRCLIGAVCLVVACLAVLSSFFMYEDMHWRSTESDFTRIGKENLALFRKYDRDDDGYLSLDEFEPIGHLYLTGVADDTSDLPISQESSIITLSSDFSPLVIKSLSSYDNNLDMHGNLPNSSYPGLLSWHAPVSKLKNFATEHFAALLPPVIDKDSLGKPHRLYGQSKGSFSDHLFGAPPSNNRYYPPVVEDNALLIHKLLSMFHPRTFVVNRFEPSGALTCLRAFTDHWIDISFRIHAEFQLHEPPNQPFWFTPAQFHGRVIISQDYKEIKYFKLRVPNDRRLNVDMEWLKGTDEQMEVDIGYMPQMELTSTSYSRPAFIDEQDQRESLVPPDPDYDPLADLPSWLHEVDDEVCREAMQVEFYPFLAANYVNYTEAFDKAEKEDRLVHSIVLWGALDDQSC